MWGLSPDRGICSARTWPMPLSSWTCSRKPRRSTRSCCSPRRRRWPGRRPWSKNFSTRWDPGPRLLQEEALRWVGCAAGSQRLGCLHGFWLAWRPLCLPPDPQRAPVSSNLWGKVMAYYFCPLVGFCFIFYFPHMTLWLPVKLKKVFLNTVNKVWERAGDKRVREQQPRCTDVYSCKHCCGLGCF